MPLSRARWPAGVLAVLATGPLLGCQVATECDAEAVKAFHSLPPAQGVAVDLRGEPGLGCTDTVQPTDPAGFVSHYEHAMRDAGWEVQRDGDGIFGKGSAGGLRLDPLEGTDVGVYVLSPREYATEQR